MRHVETRSKPERATVRRHGARAWRSLGVLGAIAFLALGAVRRLDAQADVPLGVRRAIGAPSQEIRAVGDVALCRALDCQRTMSGALELAPSPRWRVVAEGATGRSVVQPASALSTDARLDLFYGTAERQLWIGRGSGSPRGVDSAGPGSNRWIEYGAALRWRSVSVAVDVGHGAQTVVGERTATNEPRVIQSLDSLTGVTHVDTVMQPGSASSVLDRARWSSTALRLGWRSDDWRLGVVLGRASATAGRPVTWTTTEVERRVGRSIGVVASLGTYPGSLVMNAATEPRAGWMLGVGLTAATGRRTRDAPPPPPPAATSEPFAAIHVSPGRYRIVVHLPDATQVELASDLTAWKPVAMQRASDDGWFAELPASTGAHRISLRVDGGQWIAPPGLSSDDDGFGGSAAVFIIP
jgi:hypothetical protein